ncbi:MAG: hypothetical protein PHQ52_04805 [Candidatus Omnitrophica bacterium]|nr:hypothetical protein [Candidatus Omnitrophota bacterium]
MKKEYKKPKIKSVQLNPEQSLLQICKVGGIYLKTLITSQLYCATRSTGLGPLCNFTPKGGAGGGTRLSAPGAEEFQALPS